MKFLNKKSAFIAALIGVIFFWQEEEGRREARPPNPLEFAFRSAVVAGPSHWLLNRPN